ncbi:MAG: DNA translocase FtsK, partial [Parafannyhessea sp.]|uniref:DNA translocase FtsK n=1 Tax=Parafannyhessea sp. TaxID=2847324 RepID=UPI003F0721D1
FFVEHEEPVSKRVAVGLALVVVAILGILSINMPNAEANPGLVIAMESVGSRGGYVGGAVAWCLLKTVGATVGNVILVGVIAAGCIVCGFSLSDAVQKLRDRMQGFSESREAARQDRLARRNLGMDGQAAMMDETADMYDGDAVEPLGRRKTTLLRRNRAEAPADVAPEATDDEEEQPTTLLSNAKTTLLKRRKKHPPLDEDEAVPAGTAGEKNAADAAGAEAVDATQTAPATAAAVKPEEPAVPDFLKQAKGSGIGKGGSSDSAHATTRAARPSRPRETPAVQTAIPQVAAAASTAARRAAAPKDVRRPGDGSEDYELPPFSMLSSNPNSANSASSKEELDETKERLQGTLREFGLTSRVVDYVSGPLVTTFRIEMGEGERVSKIKNLEDDIALTLAAEKVRIFAPIRGTSYVGIEIPNSKRANVHLGDVLPYATGGPLEVAIGRDSAGKPVVADIAKMPHMLVAGTTGSGKSVLINSMVMSLLMRTTPKQVRLIMIDPKRVEFSCYNGLPHLYVPVVTDPRQAASALQWAVSEMERRLKVFERAGARNIKVYNQMCTTGKLSEMDNPPEPMPYIVVVIDELSDLMMTAGKDVEASIVRIAQLARAAGIHLVIATQRPSANVVTGLIKSNIDSRVALKVSSGIDSRVILDETGAERLLGNGDMLFKDRGLAPKRVLGCYTSDDEIEAVVGFIRDQAEPDYHNEILSQVVPGQPGTGRSDVAEDDDPLVWEAAQIVVDSQLGSTSGLQRRLKVGYARAGRIMDMLESKGVVGPPEGSKPREVLLDKDGLEELRTAEAQFREV